MPWLAGSQNPGRPRLFRVGTVDLSIGQDPIVVGVVNLSPESPNRDALALEPAEATERAQRLVEGGARIIDVGAQSSHFAAPLVGREVEIARLVPTISVLKERGFVISVDTWDSEVASAAASAGADLINDSDGLQDEAMIEILRSLGLPVVIPFLTGPDPRRLGPLPDGDPVDAILTYFNAALDRASRAGISRIILDPGTGYARHQLTVDEKEQWQRLVYRGLDRIRALGHPVMVALPRKADRSVTLDLARMIIENGADLLRAHDPAIAREALVAAKASAAEQTNGPS